jgi:butyrate kinase
MSKYILVINPGGTTSKLGLFDGEKCIHQEKVIHSDCDIEAIPRIADQRAVRLKPVREFLKGRGFQKGDLLAVVGRGGLLQPLASGTYAVNKAMLADLEKAARGEHASNLGAPMALDIATEFDCPAFIVDPVAVDEMEPVARFTGVKGVERQSLSHALNMKAVAKRHARVMGKRYEDMNIIVAHMGSGTSLSAHKRGRMIDVINPKDEGPISGDRAGAVPSTALIDMCFAPGANPKDIKKKLFGDGGLYSLLGTRDIRDAIARMEKGDAEARAVLEAMAYQVAKYIGEMATVLKGKVDAILLTGGMVFNPPMPEWVRESVEWIAPVTFYPGEDELQALAEGALRALNGEEPVKTYGA